MAIISEISVGDIFYYLLDDKPSHSAPKGSVSIIDSNGGFENTAMYVNNDGGSTWIKIVSPAYGVLSTSGNTNGVDFDGQTIGSWYAWNSAATFTLVKSSSFSRQTDATFGDYLRYDGIPLIRALVRQTSTNRGGTAKWMSWQIGVAQNFSVPQDGFNGFFVNDNSATQTASAARVLQFATNNSAIAAISPVQREGGGGPASRTYLSKHCTVSVIKLDEALTRGFFSENWETNSFSTNSWNIVNDTTNVWVVGSAQNNTSGGTYSAYISDDGGTSASYTITTANVSHFYKDFTFSGNADSIILSFSWKCQGENTAGNAVQYDYGTVVITDTTVTPVAGTEVSTTQAAAGGNGRLGAPGNLGKFNLGYGTTPGTTWNTESISLTAYRGQTKRLVFSWVNDGGVGADPAFIVDNIKIEEFNW